ncbi:putative SCP-like extracellular protein [Taphrina deformans PYCC 5710]|uniref:SCP-like extracellular protein n=1 Tax=Taphrina deformans (strain PYCC 5710 / ATCC 11124 / CBS 356.35 / IMI 108563 / JCM 9778 / NBRC 8474) TaxID=1097556 RepID=R4X6A8_TAPDE|nr:putative SCP-like extracellular protein [Taphrina deformans PYCC 5710]|eukprot:CCG80559.1 putative SCP-like extracellular protein [Taphrina deformans PYCC 5710]
MQLSLFTLSVLSTVSATLSGLSYPYESQQAFIDDMLAQHNKYRALHGANPVTWNATLAQAALNNAGSGTWAHTTNNPYGENIATGTYTDPDYYGYLWYNEIGKYDFNNPGFSEATGHFTQMVWASTTEIGCAVSDNVNNLGYPYSMTCEYSPAGNVVNAGYFAANVKPLVTSGAQRSVGTSVAGLMAAAAVGAYMLL